MSQAEKDSRKMLMYSFQGGPYTDEQVIHLRDKKKKTGKFSAEHSHFTLQVSVILNPGICYNLQLVSFLTDIHSTFPSTGTIKKSSECAGAG